MSGALRAVLSARMLGSLVVTLNGIAVDTSSSRRTPVRCWPSSCFTGVLLYRGMC